MSFGHLQTDPTHNEDAEFAVAVKPKYFEGTWSEKTILL